MSDARTLFKWLGENGEAFHGGRGRWPLPTQQMSAANWRGLSWLGRR